MPTRETKKNFNFKNFKKTLIMKVIHSAQKQLFVYLWPLGGAIAA